MKTNRSRKIAPAGLLAAALLFAQLDAQAAIIGPYTADANLAFATWGWVIA